MTVAELGERMGSLEVAEWRAYFGLEAEGLGGGSSDAEPALGGASSPEQELARRVAALVARRRRD